MSSLAISVKKRANEQVVGRVERWAERVEHWPEMVLRCFFSFFEAGWYRILAIAPGLS